MNPALLELLAARAAGTAGMTHSYLTTLVNSSTASSYQWTGASLGAAASDRHIIAMVLCRGGAKIPTVAVDIAGSRATLDFQFANYSHVSFHRLAVPSGATATIDLTVTDGDVNASGVSVSLYRIVGGTPTVRTTYGGAGPVLLSGCVAGDVVLAGSVKDAVLTWSGATLNYEWPRPWRMYHLSTQAAAGDVSISATGNTYQAAGIAYTLGA